MNQELLMIIGILVGAAFLPSLIYLRWIRNAKKVSRPKYNNLSKSFIWGAIFAVIMAVVLSLIFIGAISTPELKREYVFLQDETIFSLIVVCVIAPLVEEFTKMLGVFTVRDYIYDIEDGLIFGAAAGLGFAATENLLYEGTTFFQHGVEAFIVIVIVRSVASTLLHGSASAVAGYGISKKLKRGNSILPYYLLAVIMHGGFNYLASLQLLYGGRLPLLALGFTILIAIIAVQAVRGKIRKLSLWKY